LRDIAAEAGPPKVAADAAWRAGRRRRTAKLTAAATSVAGVIALVLAFVVVPGTTRSPASTSTKPSPSATPAKPSPRVSVTVEPAKPASADALATAARLIRERIALLHLPDTGVQVSGPAVVMTGPAVDVKQLQALATPGVLNLRQVLLYQQYTGAATYGNASLVHHNTLKLFHKLSCTPGNTTTWQAQVGYSTAADYDNPDTQIVMCDSIGGKYVLDVAVVPGTQIVNATAMLSPGSNQWQVAVQLKSAGAAAFAHLTSMQAATYFAVAQAGNQNDRWLDTIAFVRDGQIITAPQTEGTISGGMLQVAGNFTRVQIEELAAQLKTGALPVDFHILSITTASSSPSSQATAG
jgi:preprotein translocase subunit SecD